MKTNSLLLTDFYKIGHPFQYPKGTIKVYSNLTARKSRLDGVDEMVLFGLQYFIKEYLINHFNDNFFAYPKENIIQDYSRTVRNCLGGDLPTYKHIEDLHDLGYLPIEIKALPEGSKVRMRVPVLTIVNTLPDFYWLTNFIESIMSAVIWQPCTSATIAHEYKKILTRFANETGMPKEFIQWQGHDFSFRGMSSLESAILSGMGHLLSFTGTDTIPAIEALEYYYNANSDKELIGGSVPATEHSVMCAGAKDGEVETFKRLITEVYPTGTVSIVSDTWNLWDVVKPNGICDRLKKEILDRDGKVVIRPDSGDPVLIICGNPDGKTEEERKGVIELLWEVFGGTETSKGYKLLDSHIGAIYGDSITRERAKEICQRLMDKGFASQVVFGIGSYTYQYNTRDTFGMAMKATYVEIMHGNSDPKKGAISGHGYIERKEIFKDPITDDGTKKSATGLLKVTRDDKGVYHLEDRVSIEEEKIGHLKTIFKNGELIKDYTLQEIRENLKNI